MKLCRESIIIETNDLKEVNYKINNNKLFVLIEGEEIYSRKLIVPNVKKEEMQPIIRNDLMNYFQVSEQFLFSYEKVRKIKKQLEIMVYCLNSEKMNIIKNYDNKNNQLAKVNLIQVLVIKQYEKRIDAAFSIVIFTYHSYIYLIAYKNGIIFNNTVLEDKNRTEEIEENIVDFLYKTKNMVEDKEDVPKLYFINFSYIEIKKKLSHTYTTKELGEIGIEKLKKNFKRKGKSVGEELNFLPMWYIEKKQNNAVIKLKIASLLLLIMIFWFSFNLYNQWSFQTKQNNLVTQQRREVITPFKNKEKEVDTINTLGYFIKSKSENLNFNKLNIKGKDITTEINTENQEQLFKLVSKLEEEYKIKSITKLEENRFKIVVGVK